MNIFIAGILCQIFTNVLPLKLAIAPLSSEPQATSGIVNTLGEAITAEFRRYPNFQVLSYAELKQVLSHENLRMLTGCSDPSCYANISSTLKEPALLVGSIGQVGNTWVIVLKIIDVRKVKVVSAVDKRLKQKQPDALLKYLPNMVQTLAKQSSEYWKIKWQPATLAAKSFSQASLAPMPQAFKVEKYTDAATLDNLKIFQNDKSHLLAFDPKQAYKASIFAGTLEGGLYEQRVTGSSRSGPTEWSAVFWEPRVLDRWRGQIEMRQNVLKLRCNDQEITYTVVNSSKQSQIEKQIQFFKPRWQRTAVYIAHDNTGNYFFVDKARTPKNNIDYRLFAGAKKHLHHVVLSDVIKDSKNLVLISKSGSFIVRQKDYNKKEVLWNVDGQEQTLTLLNLYQQAPMIYTQLGVYQDQALGTACDPYFTK